jgi:hypothetical protein
MWWIVGALAAQLDLGGPHDPVLEGFEPTTPADARWLAGPAVGGSLDALDDGLQDGRLRLVLPEGGRVALRLREGSTARVGDTVLEAPVRVERPTFEVSRWERAVWQHPWVTAEVSGEVVITVEGVLEAVVTAPSYDAMKAWFAEINAAAEADHVAHHPPEPAIPRVGEGLSLTPVGGWPAPGEASASWRRQVVRGEVASTTVWLDAAGRVEVDVRGLGGLDVSLASVEWVDSRGRPLGELRPRPSLLWPIRDGRTHIQGGTSTGVAVFVRVPEDAEPGWYRGSLRLRSLGVRHVVPFEVEVLPWTPASRMPVGTYLGPELRLTSEFGPGSPQVLAALDQALSLHRSLGLDAIGLGGTRTDLGSEPVSVDPVLDHALARWAALGGRALAWTDPKRPLRHDAWHDADDVPVSEARMAALGEQLARVSGQPFDVVVPMWEEEAWKDVSSAARVPAFLRHVARVVPDDVALGAHLAHPLAYDAVSAFPVVVWNGYPDATRGVADALRGDGRLWTFNLGGGRGAPLLAWHLGSETHLEWRFDQPGESGWQPPPAGKTTGYAVRSPYDDYWASVWLVRLAQGTSDAQHLATLDAWTSAGGCAEGDATSRTWLEAVRGALDGAERLPAAGGDLWEDAAFEAVRQGTLDRLRALPRCHDQSTRMK